VLFLEEWNSEMEDINISNISKVNMELEKQAQKVKLMI